ncbi:MAG TPA: hypothetical protein VMW50_02650, partial [Dehalococcoidia bacterium]|nr:hypothetical protein [Dehalococcoidia bacterium]
MKTKRTILLAFLLMLYIGPSLFAMTSYSLPSPTQQNSSKEFSLSAYGDESPDSITSFGETLPDNTLFYPDALINDTIILASNGTGDFGDSYGDYRDSWVLDGDCFGDHSDPYEFTLDFISPYPQALVDAFDLHILFEIGTNQTGYLYNDDTSTWDDIGIVDTWLGDFWLNVTVGREYILGSGDPIPYILFKSDGQTSSEAWYTETDYAFVTNF